MKKNNKLEVDEKNLKKKDENDNYYVVIEEIAKREEIDPEQVIEIILESFKKAYEENEKSTKLEFFFNSEEKKFIGYEIYKIVSKIENSEEEILENDKILKKAEKIVNKDAYFKIDLKKIQSSSIGKKLRKNIELLMLKIRREKQFKIFLPLKNKIVSGKIQSFHNNFCTVNLGKGIGYLDSKEWEENDIKNLLPKQNENFRFLIKEVNENEDLKQIILTRKGEEFVKRIFEEEIPEISEKLIEIVKIIRIPSLISKIIVKSNKFSIDAVGSCIGKKGIRIKSILREFGNERIDIVAWSENKKELISNFLSPVEIITIEEDEKKYNYNVFVLEKKMSLVLFGRGKIIEKFSEYLKIKIHIKSSNEKNIIVWNGNTEFNKENLKKDFINNNDYKKNKN